MTMGSSPLGTTALSIADLGQMAGAGQLVLDYLDARGIKAAATLALMATDEASVTKNIVQPLPQGYQKGGQTFNVEASEHPIITAVLIHMWSEAQMWWKPRQTLAPSTTTSTTTTASAGNPGTSTASTNPSTTPDKPPKTLPPQVWTKSPC